MAGLQQALFAEADDEGTGASCARGRRLDSDAEIQTSSPVALDRLDAARRAAGGSEVGAWGGALPVHRPARASSCSSRYTD